MTPEPHRFSIGQLARRTGLPVRTIRFYSDSGVVPEVDRTEAGYRLYDVEALARLELVRTLRELGVDLATIRQVLARERTVAEVAAAHAAAVDAQIRALRLRRAVLRAVASTDPDHQEIQLMTKLAALSDEERRRIIEEFVDETFAGAGRGGEVEQRMRAAAPELPDDPTPQQVEAWVDLAELVRDPSFRAAARGMARRAADEGAERGALAHPGAAKAVGEQAGAAAAAGVDPASPEGARVLGELLGVIGEPPDRATLADQIDAFADDRVERYWQLLGIVNGWPPVPSATPAWRWLAAALRASAA
ncbi:MAG TPA: MerR family transcriptional regulator [Capillimicrobium sp.]